MLKVDMYVKIVLTAIAISLMVIAFRPVLSTPAEAWEERGHFPSIAISEGRDSGHLMLWLAGDEGIELVEFSDIGRVNETYFIPYGNLWEGNWIHRVVFQEGVISQRRVEGRRILFRPSGHTKEVIIKEVITEGEYQPEFSESIYTISLDSSRTEAGWTGKDRNSILMLASLQEDLQQISLFPAGS